MHIINSIGKTLDRATAEAMLTNMVSQEIIDKQTARLMACGISERSYQEVPQKYRDGLRAGIFKNMLLTLI